MKKIVLIVLLAVSLFVIACAGTPYVKYEPQAVTDNPVGSKVGIAPVSPTGIQEAAKNAGITRIATVDIRETYDGRKIVREYIVCGE